MMILHSYRVSCSVTHYTKEIEKKGLALAIQHGEGPFGSIAGNII